MSRRGLPVALVRVLFLLCLLLSPSYAATPEEAARREGEVVFYSSLNNEQITAFRDAFQKKYPFLKVSFYRGTSERVLQRIMTEAQIGRHAVDAVSAAGFQLYALKEKGLLARYASEEESAFAKGFRDPEGQWINLHSLYNSMGYNTKLVSPGEAPRRYEDLLHPRWKGRLGFNFRDAEWFVNMLKIMGREKGTDFMRRLAAQQPGLHEGHNHLAQLLAAGEFPAAVNSYGHILAREKDRGAPVQWVLVEPVIAYLHPIALVKQAPHPNAGRLFIDFLLSREGQTMLAGQGRIPGRSDVEPQVLKAAQGVRLFPSDPSFAREYEAAGQEMRAIFLKK